MDKKEETAVCNVYKLSFQRSVSSLEMGRKNLQGLDIVGIPNG
jgi:hypothetical protein